MVKDEYKIIHVLKSGQLINDAGVKVPVNSETEVFYRFVVASCRDKTA